MISSIIIANLIPVFEQHSPFLADRERYEELHFPLGLGTIANILENAGIEYKTYDSYVDGTTEGFLKKVRKDKASIVLLSGFLGNSSYPFLKDISQKVKAINHSTIIIIGGAIASTIPHLLVTHCNIDIAVIGEGERTILEIIKAIESGNDLSKISGICFKDKNGNPIFTGVRERIKNLDSESFFPLYEAFPIMSYIKYLKNTGRCWEIAASRGCYQNCSFCKKVFGREVTSFSVQYTISHMNMIYEKYGIDRFNFVDDNFLNSPIRIKEFARALRNNFHSFKWRFQGRLDETSPETIGELVNTGLYGISYGIESGSQKMLDRYGKKINIQKAEAIIRAIMDIVDIRCSFIVGGPGENWGTIKQTKSFIKRLGLKNINVAFLTLIPGTSLYARAREDGLIGDEDKYCMSLGPTHDRPYLNISSLTVGKLLEAKRLLYNTADSTN